MRKGITFMKNIMNKCCASAALLLAALFLIPACNWGGESTSSSAKAAKTGEFVIKLGGDVVLTKDDFRDYLAMYKNAQMQQMPGFDFDAMLAQLPEDQQRMYYNGILEMQLNGALINKHICEQGWDKLEDYARNMRIMHDEVRNKLATEEFVKRLGADKVPSDREAEKFYSDNKTTNPYMQQEQFLVKAAGVQGYAVKAKDEAQAKALVSSASTNGRGLKKAATEMGLKTEDLGVVTYQSSKPDRTVVMKIMSAQKFPTIETVKSGDTWYAVESASKKEAEYAPFSQVKDLVKQVMQQDMLVKEYQNKLNQLKEQYKVDVNNEFIESLIKKSPAAEKTAPAKKEVMAEDEDAVVV